uniref:glutathione transferase n=1 Tax=Larix kaempferi TaxID=54800 RepID=V5L5X5_9CONI|nr:zeta class glutathione S-transferase [Larix kaempferi]
MASVAQENYGTSSTSARLKLYSYWRSSCSWRVRIALNLKGLPYEYKAVNLVQGEQLSEEFTKLNPVQFVPTLVDGDIIISDSLAILLYLEDKFPEHPLFPDELHLKAISLQAAALIGSTIQPLQNLSILNLVEEKLGSEERLAWPKHFIEKGFTALEKLLKEYAGKYSVGDQLTLADIFLVPQIYGAKRFNADMSKFPTLNRINQALAELPEFQAALPERQPDAKL